MEIDAEAGDNSQYERAIGDLPQQVYCICFEIDGRIDETRHVEIYDVLEGLDSIKIAEHSYLAKTELCATDLVQIFRRFLQADDAVYAFSVSGRIDWAGPKSVRKFFRAVGVQILQSEEIPTPVRPDSE